MSVLISGFRVENSSEIDTKVCASVDKITFMRIPNGNINHFLLQDTVQITRKRGDRFIRYCDVIDALIAHGSNTTPIYDLVYWGSLSISQSGCTYKLSFTLEIIPDETEYNKYLQKYSEPQALCHSCRRFTYMNDSTHKHAMCFVQCDYSEEHIEKQPFSNKDKCHKYASLCETTRISEKIKQTYCIRCLPTNDKEYKELATEKLRKDYLTIVRKKIDEIQFQEEAKILARHGALALNNLQTTNT
jgi:hypothetical protein